MPIMVNGDVIINIVQDREKAANELHNSYKLNKNV